MNSQVIKVGSLFSGGGYLDYGLEQAGLKTLYQSEIDKRSSKLLAREWSIPNYGNIKNIYRIIIPPPVDLIAAGLPCTGFSISGRGKGLEDVQSGLWKECLRSIQTAKPTGVLIENVPAILNKRHRRDFGLILSGLKKCGYYVGWRTFNSEYFGVPQRRRRVFIFAHSRIECV